jgi:hypothetical protein
VRTIGNTMREIVRKRKLTAEQREAADALMDQYMSALGDFADTPLGQAGADRMRGEVGASVPPLLVLASGGKRRLRRARMPVPREIKLHGSGSEYLARSLLAGLEMAPYPGRREGRAHRSNPQDHGCDWPDFLLVSPHGSVRFLETKRAGEELRDGQEQFRLWCLRCGIPHVVAWTLDQVLAALDGWGCLRIKIASCGE